MIIRAKESAKKLISSAAAFWFAVPLLMIVPLRKRMRTACKRLTYYFALAFAKILSKLSRSYCLIEFLPKYAEDVTACNLLTDTKENEYAIVIQGPVSGFTQESIKIYRKIFPKAVIIVSTWKNTDDRLANDLRNLADELILSDLPETSGLGNVNYQTKSSYEGMKRAYEMGIPYAMKTRTDQRIYAPLTFEYLKTLLDVFPVDESVSQYQKKRITATPSENSMSYAYWMCDFFYFGTSEDLMKFFDFPQDTRHFGGSTKDLWHHFLGSEKWLNRNRTGTRINISPEICMTKSYIQRTTPGECRSDVKHFWDDVQKRFLYASLSDIRLYWDKYESRYVNFWNAENIDGQPARDGNMRFMPPVSLSLLAKHLRYEERLEEFYDPDIIEQFPYLGTFCKGYEHLDEVMKDFPFLRGGEKN